VINPYKTKGKIMNKKLMLIMSILLSVMTGLLFQNKSYCASYIDIYGGYHSQIFSARSAGLGNTGIANTGGPCGVLTNPSLLVNMEGLEVAASSWMNRSTEERSFPIYDTFGGVLQENIYAYNRNSAYHGTFFVGIRPEIKGIPGFGVAFGIAPFLDFDYLYSEEIRDNSPFAAEKDRLIGVNEVKSEGALWGFTIGAGASVMNYVDLGLNISMLKGSPNLVSSIDHLTGGISDSIYSVDKDLKGYRFGAGLTIKPTERLTFGLNLNPGFTLKDQSIVTVTTDSIISNEIKTDISMPLEAGAGVEYHPRAGLFTKLAAEIIWTHWSEYSVKHNGEKSNPAYDDKMIFKFGVEHVFQSGVPVRFGFSQEPGYSGFDNRKTSFTAGTGFGIKGLNIDFSGGIIRDSYYAVDIFPDVLYQSEIPDLKNRVDPDRIVEKYVMGIVSLSYRFNL
jgi:hypothetical protein